MGSTWMPSVYYPLYAEEDESLLDRSDVCAQVDL